MPGDEENQYTIAELQTMSPSEFAEAKQRDFKRPLIAAPGAEARPAAAGIYLGSSVPMMEWQPPKLIGANVWGANKSGDRDFTCPSGQKCRLRPLQLEKLMMEGVLDQVTRLEGLAQALINKAEGAPPEKQKMPSKEEFSELLKLINIIVPLAVAEPRVYRDEETIPEGGITVSDIDLMDRVAILNDSLKSLKDLDNFRPTR